MLPTSRIYVSEPLCQDSFCSTRLHDPLDLCVTKPNTGRDKDLEDARHLESVFRKRYRAILPNASIDETKRLLRRFLDWEV